MTIPSAAKLRVLFMGTPDFAVPSLEALARRHDVVAVVTQPDRPRGRGRVVVPPPVGVAARQLGLEVRQLESLRGRGPRQELAEYGADVFVVAAFGKILSRRLLELPRLGCINVHASLLPRYRGAAPIQWAVLDGATTSGVTIMQMDAGIDTGAIWLQRSVSLDPEETSGTLHDKLAPLGADLLIEALELVAAGKTAPRPQDEAQATHAPLLRKEDGRVDFRGTGDEVSRWVRGMDPWPGAFAQLGGQVVKLFGARGTTDAVGEPGRVLSVDDRGMLVACGDGGVWLQELQLAGRRRLSAQAFVAGHPVGRSLGSDSRFE